MKRRHVYFANVLLERIERLREKTGASISEIIRRAVLEYLEKEEKRWEE